ncbi:branched-chain amino acid ABC transporter permease [Halopiger goleimassiliensis]|uniref:branched-chain amino acid ABC transporter permease n=1 Tax=Halopiger goleimassiliensis TaxID=1293048 RepID=UPI0006782E95|nr:branched-chain amino acid ABC transporter permease [Halopiger goleimassiliensis]
MSTGNKRGTFSDTSAQDVLGMVLLVGIVALALDLVRRVILGDLTASYLLSLVWNGVVDSLYIGLAAIGLSMTYSILRFANFSHGDLVTAGAFSGWTVAYLIGGIGTADLGSRLLLDADGGARAGALGMDIVASPLAIVIGLLAAAAGTILIALAIDRLVYKRMRGEGGIPLLIASVGVALALRYIIAIIYTQDSRGIVAAAPFVGPWELPFLPFEIGQINLHEATLVISAIVLIVGVHVLLQYTKLGKSMRAMSDNRDLALVTGIPTERVITATWAIGGGLAGVAGYLIVLDQSQITINLGWFLLLLIFAAVILGGIGSIYGALAGSLVIGITINLSLVWIPSDLNQVAAFVIMILVLVFKPDGLFGGVETA